MAYTSIMHGVGKSTNMFKLSKASRNYTTQYFQATHASGDIRIQYIKLKFTSTGGGEVYRAVAEIGGLLVATGGTVNAGHFTLKVNDGKTVSGAANALRLSLETAATNTPGGTLSVLQLDNYSGASNTLGNASFIRVSKSGGTDMPFFIYFDDDQMFKGSTATSADGIKIRFHDGTTKYLMVGS
jgi:hypothetical protein